LTMIYNMALNSFTFNAHNDQDFRAFLTKYSNFSFFLSNLIVFSIFVMFIKLHWLCTIAIALLHRSFVS